MFSLQTRQQVARLRRLTAKGKAPKGLTRELSIAPLLSEIVERNHGKSVTGRTRPKEGGDMEQELLSDERDQATEPLAGSIVPK